MFTRGPLPKEVKHRPVYTLIFSAPFHSTRVSEWKGPPAEARGPNGFLCSLCLLARVWTHAFWSDRIVWYKQIQRSYSSKFKKIIKSSGKKRGLVNHESQKYGHLWLTKRDKTCIMTKLLFFPPYILLLLLLLLFYFIFRYWDLENFVNFFPQFFYLLTFTLEKKIEKILNFLVKEMSKICPKKKKHTHTNHHQLFKIMPIVFFI
jgi:hypothetical protein